ncbi:glycosyltransferase [Gulosibacter sp. 10]|uniref:glycosyltransferase n=1 Tax=Gulosibacter sp. 10 TaxID=1255570 RepID=UPI00097EAC11|nr:glycosyltransferase [Gulosibacter sp. 10]SJM58905.1 Glycosyl transferase, family 2 [Gulosibacter sp. 10]
MRPRVTAIVVAHNAAAPLERALEALERQTWRPNRTVLVHIASKDDTLAVMEAADPDLLVNVDERASLGAALKAAVDRLAEVDAGDAERIREFGGEGDAPNDWLWFLSADNVPDPDALEELLDTTERNPSLEVTGPKIVRADDPGVLVEYGESIAPSGESVRLHEDALDQGQFEHLSDVLGVAAGGMLVRRDTWERLGGFDPGLDAVDDALDFCVRTWLSNGRVILSPGARVESLAEKATGTSRIGRRTRALQRYRIERTAALHRGLVWAGGFEFVLRWLLLLPGAFARAVLHLLRKQPGRILPDFRAALTVLFGRTRAGAARRRFRATGKHSLSSLEQLLISPSEWRTMKANRRDEYRAIMQQGRDRYNFVTGGGGWVLLLGVIVSLVLLFPLLRTGVLSGGALLPLSTTLGELWSNTGYGLRDAGGGVGVSDPFTFVLAVLGTVTFWQPSLVVVALWLLAIPLSAVGAWYLMARFTRRAWLRAAGALLWMASPTLLVSLADGRLTGLIVHVALPWLFFTGFAASRSWASAAACSLLALVVAASSPSLIPVLLVLWIVSVLLAGRGWMRQSFLPIPAAAMFLPLAVTQINRGRPLSFFADPALPVAVEPTRGWHAALLFPDQELGGWTGLLDALELPVPAALLIAVLLAPLLLLALYGLFTRGWRLALAGLGIAALGLLTAGVAGGFAFATFAGEPVPLWIGPAQSLGYLGLVSAAIAGAAFLGPLRIPVSAVAVLAALAVVIPVAPAQLTGTADVHPSDGRTLPALVDAQGRAASQLGTLVITPLDHGTMQVRLERGSGLKLDEVSTLATTNPSPTANDERLAELAVGFLSEGATNPTAELHELGIAFVLVESAESGGGALEQRLITEMSTNEALQAAGDTGDFGVLFQVVNAAEQPTDPELAQRLDLTNLQNELGRIMLIVQAAVLAFVVLLSLPTGGIAARVRTRAHRGARNWERLPEEGTSGLERFGSLSQETVEVYAEATGEHIQPATRGGQRD